MNKCEICGSDKIEKIIDAVKFEYKNKIILVKDYHYTHCEICGENVAEEKSVEKSEQILKKAKKEIELGTYIEPIDRKN